MKTNDQKIVSAAQQESLENLNKIRFKIAQIQTHSFCNAQCIMCPYKDTAHTLEQGKMEWDLFTKIIDDLITYPSLEKIVLMLQNEPLLNKRLPEEIRYVKKKKPGIKIGIATNGSLLDNRMLDTLLEAGLTSLIFSINALTEPTFARVEKELNFSTVMSNLRNLINRNPSQLDLSIKFLIIKSNAIELGVPHKFSDLIGRIKENNIPFSIEPISNRAGTLKEYREMLVFPHLQSSTRKLYCDDIFNSVNVLFNGDVIVCCADWMRKSIIGNFRIQTYREIWYNPSTVEWRVKTKKGLYRDLVPCNNCSQAWNIMKNLATPL